MISHSVRWAGLLLLLFAPLHWLKAGETKVFGAGILSSTGEIPFSLSNDVEHRPFVTNDVIKTDYDPSRMQDLLYIIPSFAFLRREIEQLVKRFDIPVL